MGVSTAYLDVCIKVLTWWSIKLNLDLNSRLKLGLQSRLELDVKSLLKYLK